VDLSKSDDESCTSKSLIECKDLAARLSGTFVGAARNKHRSDILKIARDGIEYAFVDSPKQLSFLEGAVLHFVSKLPVVDILEM
jgi:cohesin complex subunit SA-1/2